MSLILKPETLGQAFVRIVATILIADAVSERRTILWTFLRADDHIIVPISTQEEAIRLLEEVRPDLVITEGTQSWSKLVSEARHFDSGISLILILAGPPSVEEVVGLMNQGISDVLVSPLDINDVQTKVERALNRRPAADAVQIRFRNLIGSSAKMQQVFRKIVRSSASDVPLLILGERGTGKQAVAHEIHALSARKAEPFRSVHCGGLKGLDLESELFGHEPGTFPWAVEQRRGQIELTEGGTLCLNEIGALSPVIQAKVLRFLEQQTLERLGGNKPVLADVRILGTNSEPLSPSMQEGTFRSDLYYALSTSVIDLPPLRARVNDIPELVELFLSRYDMEIAGEAMEVLMNYGWPGNVDELKNAVEQSTNSCEGTRVGIKDLPTRILKAVSAGGRRYKFIPQFKEADSDKEPNGP